MFEKYRKLKLDKRLGVLEKEITSLKNKLNDVNEKKEFWFKKKEGLKKELNRLISKVKEIKLKKDNFDETIKNLKDQRNKYNKEVGDLIFKVKLLNSERSEAFKKFNLRLSPSKIKDRIDELEKKIEIEAMPFKREQKLMKQINKLRNSYEKGAGIKKIVDKIDQFSSEISSSKEKADSFHKMIQEQSRLNQNDYEEFIENSRKINDLRKEQENAFKKFLELKRTFVETNDLLKNKLTENARLKGDYNKLKEYLEKKHRDRDDKVLEEKTRNVEEKLRKKQKLTNEDLLVFQKKEEENERFD